jgi:DNA-binding response OmpR family regulator
MAGRLLLIGELNADLNELKISFEALGLTVDTAPDSLAGLERGREWQPDLVVTEILTNRLSGFELASRIGSGAAGFSAPVIFYTEFYRDEKARRDVLAKYGAIHYFVRPFQKDALKKSVATHFQDFLSSIAGVPIATITPEPPADNPEVNTVVPELSRAAAAAEQQAANSLSGRPTQRGETSSFSGEDPSRFDAFNPAEPTSSSDVTESDLLAAAAPDHQPVAMPPTPIPRAETVPVSTKASKSREPSLLLPIEEPSWIGRLAQSTPVRIAALVIVAALALYLARDRFQSSNEEVLTLPQAPVSTQPSPTTQAAEEPPAPQLASPPATVPSTGPPAQDPPVLEVPKAETELAKPPLSSAAALSEKPDSVKKVDTAESSTTARERSPGLSIQDVTGSGRGPVLKKIKPIQLSQEILTSLAAKSVVVRVVIDNAGKVTEVSPLNQEGAAVSLPPDALATIQQWEFSRSRRKEGGHAVKYFSLKVQNP